MGIIAIIATTSRIILFWGGRVVGSEEEIEMQFGDR
jgi:hypothetical protein